MSAAPSARLPRSRKLTAPSGSAHLRIRLRAVTIAAQRLEVRQLATRAAMRHGDDVIRLPIPPAALSLAARATSPVACVQGTPDHFRVTFQDAEVTDGARRATVRAPEAAGRYDFIATAATARSVVTKRIDCLEFETGVVARTHPHLTSTTLTSDSALQDSIRRAPSRHSRVMALTLLPASIN
jgi:hypothetical protein